MSNISRSQTKTKTTADSDDEASADSDDDSDDDKSNDKIHGNKKYPTRLKKSGLLLVREKLQNKKPVWVQLHAVVDFNSKQLQMFSHAEAKKPKFKYRLTSSNVSLGRPTPDSFPPCSYPHHLRHPLSFTLTTANNTVLKLRAFSLLQLWEWVCCFTSLSKPTRPNTSHNPAAFTWSGTGFRDWALDDLEKVLEITAQKNLLHKHEHEATWSSANAMGDFATQLSSQNDQLVLATSDHATTHGTPKGSVMTAVEGSRCLKLPPSDTMKLLVAAPPSRPLRIKFRVPAIARASASVKHASLAHADAGAVWTDCILLAAEGKLSFEHGGEHLPSVDIATATVCFTNVGDKKYPVQLVVGDVTIRFATFKKMIEFACVFLEGVLLSHLTSFLQENMLLASLDAAGIHGDESEDDDDDSSDESDDGEEEGGEETAQTDFSRLVIFSSDTPNKDHFASMIKCQKAEYDFETASMGVMVGLLRKAKEKAQEELGTFDGFKSVALACHGPPGEEGGEDGGVCMKISERMVITDDAETQALLLELGHAVESGAGRVDLFACTLPKESFDAIEKETKANFAASVSLTGNPKDGGDWVMESDGVDVRDFYFHDAREFDNVTKAAPPSPIDVNRTKAMVDDLQELLGKLPQGLPSIEELQVRGHTHTPIACTDGPVLRRRSESRCERTRERLGTPQTRC